MKQDELEVLREGLFSEIDKATAHIVGRPAIEAYLSQAMEPYLSSALVYLTNTFSRKTIVIFNEDSSIQEEYSDWLYTTLNSVRNAVMEKCDVQVVLESERGLLAPLFTSAERPMFVGFGGRRVWDYHLHDIEDSVVVDVRFRTMDACLVPTQLDVSVRPPPVLESITIPNSSIRSDANS